MKRIGCFVLTMIITIMIATNCSTSKIVYQADGWDKSYGGADKSFDSELLKLRELIAPKFKTLKFDDEVTGRTLPYNLFEPENYDKNKSYPLVLFLHDGSCVGKRVEAPLMQGYGAIIWATEESQSKNPAFVLAPAYVGPEPVTNDDWQVSEEMDITIRLLDYVVDQYSIDKNRLYVTGQSMGCMMALYLNANHPNLFAASMFVAGQWDVSVLSPLINMNFFYIVSEADHKAPAGMEALRVILEKSGVIIGETKFAANLPSEEQEKYVQDLIQQEHTINFVVFDKRTVAPHDFVEDKSEFFVEHMYSFDCAYKLESVRDWLFLQKK
jgi:predicted peptidase